MKKNLIKSLLFISVFTYFSSVMPAQVPEGFNYMAIARNGDGDPVANSDIGVKIAIKDADATIAWEEEHAVTTDAFGLFQLVIGDPLAVQTGGYEANFADINWAAGNYFVSTSISLVTGTWIPMGSAQLFSVPYAMVSKTALGGVGNPFTMYGDTVLFMNPLHVKSSNSITDEEALFAVRRQDGQTMFAVYNQGVRINIPMDDAIKGAKGGFAIGGFSGYKGTTHNLFVLNKDSARIFIDQTPDLLPKGAKGGFAIGGFSYASKADVIRDYLFVAPDSARIYVKDPAKGAKGGFAIGGFGAFKGSPATNFMDITPDNYFIGHESGTDLDNIDPGLYNSVIGYQAGKNLTTGSYNTILGYNAGISATSGEENIIIGRNSGHDLTSGIHNTLIGNGAGYHHTDQEYNVMIGTSAGANIIAPWWSGSFNTFMGINSGYQIRNGKNNTLLGTNAGYWLDNGNGNTFIGTDAGRSRGEAGEPHAWRSGESSSNNVLIGNRAGYGITSAIGNVIIGNEAGSSVNNGQGNIFIGNQAGMAESGNDKLYIHNQADDPPLLYGDFSVNQLGINTKTLGKTLSVGGDAFVSGNLTAGSITGPISGSVTGNLTGDVTGNLTGNVTGDVDGNLTGSVNGVETGKIYLPDNGRIQSTASDKFILWWDKEGFVTLENSTGAWPCHYWWRMITKGETTFGEGVVAETPAQIITGANTNGAAFEVHFGFPDPGAGYCSVWVQFIEGILVGHYIKY